MKLLGGDVQLFVCKVRIVYAFWINFLGKYFGLCRIKTDININILVMYRCMTAP